MSICLAFNTMRPRQNCCRCADNIFKCLFSKENAWISNEMSLKGPINNIPALVLIMAWHRPGDTPLYEPVMVSSLTNICVTRPQWVKYSRIRGHNDVIMSALASQITSLTIVYSTVYLRSRSKNTSRLCVTGLCEGNSPETGEFTALRASNAEKVSFDDVIMICWFNTGMYFFCSIIMQAGSSTHQHHTKRSVTY